MNPGGGSLCSAFIAEPNPGGVRTDMAALLTPVGFPELSRADKKGLGFLQGKEKCSYVWRQESSPFGCSSMFDITRYFVHVSPCCLYDAVILIDTGIISLPLRRFRINVCIAGPLCRGHLHRFILGVGRIFQGL